MVPFDRKLDQEHARRYLHRLELRYRTARNALAAACAVYASLRGTSAATERQLHQALLRIRQATRHLIDVQESIDLLQQGEDDSADNCA